MKLLARSALISALVLCACVALPRRGQLTMRDVQFGLRDRTLSSGLRIIAEEDHTEPLVTVVTLVGAGGTADPKGKEGLAHLVEHLTFRSRQGTGPNVWNRLEQAGAGTINAFTSLDYTVYYAVGPKEILPQLLELHGKLLTQPIVGIDPAIFEVEREVVRSELRQRVETGWVSQAFNLTQAAVFPPGHPYHRPVIGTHESLSAITADDVKTFTEKHYRPDNATMVVIGDVDLSFIDASYERHLPVKLFTSSRPIPTRMAEVAPEPPVREKQPWVVHRGSVLTPEVWIGWSMPRGFDADSHLMDFAVRSAQANLWGAFVADNDILNAEMELVPGKEASLLLCRVELAEGANPQKSAERVLDQLYKVWGSSSGPAETVMRTRTAGIQFAQRRLTSVVDMLERGQQLTERAVFRAETTHFFKDPVAYTRALGSMARVEESKVTDFAFKYLNRDRARMVYLAPYEGTEEPPAVATGLGVEASDDVATTASQAPLALRRRPAPKRFGTAVTTRLPNGVEVIVLPKVGLPLVTVGVGFRTGLTWANGGAVSEIGTSLAFPASRLWGEPHEIGGNSSSVADEDSLLYFFQGASGNLPNLLAMASERVTSMKIDEWVLREVKHEFFPKLKAIEGRPDEVARRSYAAALFGEHPYGKKPVAADLEKVEFSQVNPWLAAAHAPAQSVVTIVGDVKPDEALKLAQQWFGGPQPLFGAPPVQEHQTKAPVASGTGPAEASAPRAPPSQSPEALALMKRTGGAVITHKPGSTQAQLRMGCLLPADDQPTRVRHALLASVLGTRLNQALREQMGATYGIGGRAEFYRGGITQLEVAGAVDGARLGRVLEVVKTTLDGFAKDGLPPTLVDRARWHLIRQREVAFQSNRATALELLEARNLDQGDVAAALAELDAYPKHLEAVTAEQLKADVKACVSRMVTSAMGDEPRIRAAMSGVAAQ